jgi:glycogen debranching enzyme
MIRIDCTTSPLHETGREWLETDSRGGYASSTISGCHIRRYHGLLVANLKMPEGRHVLLSKLEDSLRINGKEFFFTCHKYPLAIFPPIPSLLREFALDIGPRFIYQVGPIVLKKSILMIRNRNTTLIRYDIDSGSEEGLLTLKPFLAFRGYHRLARENPHIRSRIEEINNGFKIEPYEGMPALFINTSMPSCFRSSPAWYNRFEYTEERERGFDSEEDLFIPGVIDVRFSGGGTVILSVSCEPPDEEVMALWETEMLQRRGEFSADERLIDRRFMQWRQARPAEQTLLWQSAPAKDVEKATPYIPDGKQSSPADAAANPTDCNRPIHSGQTIGFTGDDRNLLLALIQAGRQFMIKTPSGRPAIIAGYPWFECWGRDTLISLPGLTFCTGRVEEGIEILTEIGRHEREGLLPNFFSADGTPEAYNTVDSSLLYFWAVQELLRSTGDTKLIYRLFWPVMKRILSHFMEGTRFRIGMDASGLLHAGDGQTALTWMDATVGGTPVTPRHGFAVEINALWYNALCFTSGLAKGFNDPVFQDGEVIPLVRHSFRETFWNNEGDCLGDVFHDGILDKAVRPNQIFAVSLPFSPLETAEQEAVVRTVREQLLTPCGLRTLSPANPAYQGLYRGNGATRDAAYHQGTVWPWLLGPFGEAALRVTADRAAEKESLRHYLHHFLQSHMREAGIGSVSEVFDGDAPHLPGGCIAQAWSVAELIRLYTLLID